MLTLTEESSMSEKEIKTPYHRFIFYASSDGESTTKIEVVQR